MSLFVMMSPKMEKSLKMAMEIDLVGQSSQKITQVKEVVDVFNTIKHNMQIS